MFKSGAFAFAAAIAVSLIAGFANVNTATAATPAVSETIVEQQLLAAINADRTQAGLPALVVDPRLTAIARTRNQFMLDHGYFSHCVDGQAACTPERLHFGILLAQAGMGGYAGAENLAANNVAAAVAAGVTNQEWLNSPYHKENVLDPTYNATGLSSVCCTSMQGVGGVRMVTQIFQAYPADVLATLQQAAEVDAK